jgi:pimeloyl-ACP methyl ester carboxylesterase
MRSALLSILCVAFGCGRLHPQVFDAGPTDGALADAATDMPAVLAVPCTDSLDAVYVTPSGLPAFTPIERGAVVRCAQDGTMTTSDVSSALDGASIGDVMPTTGVSKLRVAYRTERSGATPGIGSAEVLIPDHPVPGAPLIVVAHGTAGLAASCAPSKSPPAEVIELGLPFAATGHFVIEPDYAGLGTDGVQGYLISDDTAHSVLDAARALHRLFGFDEAARPVVVVGHSQGGGATLSAQAFSRAYYPEGKVLAVVAESTAWTSLATDAQLTALAEHPAAPLSGAGAAITTLQIAAAAAAALGVDHEYDLFSSTHRANMKSLLETDCVAQLITDVPKETPTVGDLLDPIFRLELDACLKGSACKDPAASYLMFERTNNANFVTDGSGPQVLQLQGLKDTVVLPAMAACTIQSLEQAGVKVQVCTNPNADHGGLPPQEASFVLRWVDAIASGSPPPSCDSSGLPACSQ